MIGFFGHTALRYVNYFLYLFAFSIRIFHQMLVRPKAGRVLVSRIIVQQIYFTAVQALPVIIPIALLVGNLVIVHFARLSGQYDFGRVSVLLIVRELGPGITALTVILRSATAVTIEISYMQVLHEINALEMMGIDPVWAVCLPRLAGITSAIMGLFVVFNLVSIFGGYAVGWMFGLVPTGNFFFKSPMPWLSAIWLSALHKRCYLAWQLL